MGPMEIQRGNVDELKADFERIYIEQNRKKFFKAFQIYRTGYDKGRRDANNEVLGTLLQLDRIFTYDDNYVMDDILKIIRQTIKDIQK